MSRAAILDYMSGPHDGPRCDCRHDGTKWTKRCVAATKSDSEESGKWAADHIRANPNTRFLAEYLALAAPYLGKTGYTNNEDLR